MLPPGFLAEHIRGGRAWLLLDALDEVADAAHRETLRNVIDTMGDALMISDLQGKVWEVNREFSSLTGHPRSEVIGMIFPYPWLIDEEMSRLVVWLAALSQGELSLVYPLSSLQYLMVLFAARLFLKEKMDLAKITGTLLIASGIVLISLS